jgi:hypothetical protein
VFFVRMRTAVLNICGQHALYRFESNSAIKATGSGRSYSEEAKAADLYVKPNEPALQLSLQKLMELYRIPGFSIAVIDDYKIA